MNTRIDLGLGIKSLLWYPLPVILVCQQSLCLQGAYNLMMVGIYKDVITRVYRALTVKFYVEHNQYENEEWRYLLLLLRILEATADDWS